MKTAVDTNVLVDVLAASPFLETSRGALEIARAEGALCICETVFAELGATFGGDLTRSTRFLRDLGITLDRSSATVLTNAGRLWADYRAAGGKRRRILPDFLIGAHAREVADRFLTRDRGYYRQWFEGLAVVAPDEMARSS